MSDDGKNILRLVKQMRELCQQVSLLLRTADEQMTKAEWDSEGNNAVAGISYSIMNPAEWIPIMIFRFYKNKDYPRRLAFVSVLLDDHWERKYTIKEPLVSAGFFDHADGELSDDDWDYWYSRVFGYLSKDHNLKADGQPFQFNRTMLSADKQGKIKSGTVFALPLVLLTNADDVGSQVTVRLISLRKGEN